MALLTIACPSVTEWLVSWTGVLFSNLVVSWFYIQSFCWPQIWWDEFWCKLFRECIVKVHSRVVVFWSSVDSREWWGGKWCLFSLLPQNLHLSQIFPTIDSLPASGLTPRTFRLDHFFWASRFFAFSFFHYSFCFLVLFGRLSCPPVDV